MTTNTPFQDAINSALKSGNTSAIENNTDISGEDFAEGIAMFESLQGEEAMKVGSMLRKNLGKRIAGAKAKHAYRR